MIWNISKLDLVCVCVCVCVCIAPKWGRRPRHRPSHHGSQGAPQEGGHFGETAKPTSQTQGHPARSQNAHPAEREREETRGGEYTGHALRGVTKLKDSDGSTSKAEAECEGRPGQRQGATPDGRRGAQRQTITELKRTYSKGVIHSDLLVALADTLK